MRAARARSLIHKCIKQAAPGNINARRSLHFALTHIHSRSAKNTFARRLPEEKLLSNGANYVGLSLVNSRDIDFAFSNTARYARARSSAFLPSFSLFAISLFEAP